MEKRKGFTLVELLVVIAILAILATVSVVGYLLFTEKAHKSVDESLCTQYNNLLAGESVTDKDITLGEFIVIVEENGINSNYFKTSSKDYVFAYDSKNLKTVLLDSTSGEVMFPENYPADKELWTIYPENNIAVPGVSNYTLLSSVVYNNSLSNVKDLTFDLNNYIMQVNSCSNETTVMNGTVVVKGTNTNIKVDESSQGNTNVVDTTKPGNGNWGQLIDKANSINFNNFTNDNNASVKVIENKFFGNTGKEVIGQNITSSSFSTDTTKVIFKNCVFVGINLGLYSMSFEFDNCSVMNSTGSYPITVSTDVKTFEFINSSLIDCNRGINLNLNIESALIEGSTFNLTTIETDKNERKDMAIQLNSSTYPDRGLATVTIKNNKIEKAKSMIELHSGLVVKGGSADDCSARTEADIKKYEEYLVDETKLIITGNTIASGIDKTSVDPGIYKDYEGTDKIDLPAYKARIEAMATMLANRIK